VSKGFIYYYLNVVWKCALIKEKDVQYMTTQPKF
jgi:hypothetical protein